MTMTETERCLAVPSGRVGIVCRYHGPTNHRGTRISVGRSDARPDGSRPDRICVGWDHALNTEENYTAAVQEYVSRMGWDGVWVVGCTNDGAYAVRVPGALSL